MLNGENRLTAPVAGAFNPVRRAADAAWSSLLTDTSLVTRFVSTLERLLILTLDDPNKGSHYQRELCRCLKYLSEEVEEDPSLLAEVESKLNDFNRQIGYRVVLRENGKLQLYELAGKGDERRNVSMAIAFDPDKSRLYYEPPSDWLTLTAAERLAIATNIQPVRRYLRKIAGNA
jgi:hypothetical protein